MGKKAKRKPAAAAQKRIRPQQPSPPSSPPASAESGIELVLPAAAAAAAGDEEQEGATTAGSVKCRHVGRGVNVEKLEEKLGSGVPHCCWECNREKQPKRGVPKKKGQSHGVQKKGLDDDDGADRPLWMCLACAHVGCEKASHGTGGEDEATEKSFGAGHALEHSRRLRHPLVLQCGDGLSIWCFECKSSIVRQSDLVGGLVTGPKATLLQLSVKLLQESQLREAGKIKGSEMRTVDEPGSAPGEQGKNGIVRGLMNLGNTCFFNSVMQNLLAVKHLQEHFLNEPARSEGPLTSALRRFFQDINTSGSSEQETNSKAATKGRSSRDKASYNPKGLFGAICAKSSRFKSYQQQDSHELLRCLLDGLHVEEDARSVAEDPVEGQTKASKDSSKTSTFVDRFFGGQFASTVSCCECGHSSSVFEPFLDLSLPIPHATKVPTSNGVSKREAKARKAVDRKKRPPASKSSSAEVIPAEKTLANSSTNKDSEPGISISDEASWLDYLADDWSEEFAESTSQSDCITSISSDLNVVPTAITGGCEAPSDLDGKGQLTHYPESSSTADEAVSIAESSAVILLPYWDQSQVDSQSPQSAQNEWEVVPAGGDFDGLGDLFQEEEASVATNDVGSCGMNQEGVGGRFEVSEQSCVDGFDLVAKEAKDSSEPIIEESIVPMTLQGCLSAFTKLEILSGDNAWACENCSLIQERSKEQNSSQDDDAPRGSTLHGIRIDFSSQDRSSGGTAEEMATLSSNSQSESSNELDDSGNHSQEVNSVADEDVVPSGKRKPQKKSAKKELVRRNATQSLVINRAPPVLTIHLKRFAQDWRGRLNKLTGHVAFEELLNLNPFQVTKDSEPCLYYLVGVVEHSGTMRGGHYVAYVRAPNRGHTKEEAFWYYISDSDVRRATLEQVLRSEAYLLFYERTC